jgi:hypothetical protein
MRIRRTLRDAAFRLARKDLADFLEEHEQELLRIFREEIHQLDEDIPEENLFIDIRMVPLGEALIGTTLRALRRFLREGTGDESAGSLRGGED